MAERPQHDSKKDQGKFSKGKSDVRKSAGNRTVKDTAKTSEAKRSKGGRERNPG